MNRKFNQDDFTEYFDLDAVPLPSDIRESIRNSTRRIQLKRSYEIVTSPIFDLAVWWESNGETFTYSIYNVGPEDAGKLLQSGAFSRARFDELFAEIDGVLDVPRLLPTLSTVNQVDSLVVENGEMYHEFLIRGSFTFEKRASEILMHLFDFSGIQFEFENR